MAVYEIPLRPGTPQSMAIPLAGVTYTLQTKFLDAPDGGWVIDIDDVNGNALAHGLPLITGADLIEQYPDIGFGFQLWVRTDYYPSAVPSWNSLGNTSHLYAVW